MPKPAATPNPLPSRGRFALRRPPAGRKSDRVRVLIVDDHAFFAEVLEITLAAEPRIEVAGRARDGLEALASARTLLPDVVVMDLEMPVMDGLEATRRIRSELPASQVVVLTGSSDPENERRARTAGAAAYLRKGCPAAELLAALFEAVAPPRAERTRAAPGLARVHPCAA
jgi:two-component system, NarL family, response regulator LiaR